MLDRLVLPELPTLQGERVILRRPSRLRYHLMFTVRPRSGPEKKSVDARRGGGRLELDAEDLCADPLAQVPGRHRQASNGRDFGIDRVPVAQQLSGPPHRLVIHIAQCRMPTDITALPPR